VEPEGYILELRGEITHNGITKSCAAFANTLGGLLLVGVEKTGNVAGIERGGEAALFIKDVLQHRVTPMPPVRARWVSLAAAGILPTG
jgi:predicted HTH transcriptional regulator